MRQLRDDTHLILDGEVRVYFKNTPNTHFLPCFGAACWVESLC